MRKLIAILAACTLIAFGGVAMADDPDGDIQAARDLLAQADALLAAEQAKPPVVMTVTETVTATVTTTITETVTATSTTPPPTTPPPTTTSPPPPTECTGVNVAPGPGLRAAMNAASAGTTFCLSAGTYTVSQQTDFQLGDRIVGAGRNATIIDGSGLDPNHSRIFLISGVSSAVVRDLDIRGTPVPASAGTCISQSGNQGNAACGKAFVNFGSLQLINVDCHDNGGNCVGGGGNLLMDNVDCFRNGSPYSMTSGFSYAACLKNAAVYGEGNDVTIRNSTIRDNPGNGIWCDFCKFGKWDIHDNVFLRNGNHGIQWEMSGGWTADDEAHVYDNTFSGNGTNLAKFAPGGMVVSTSGDILVETNVFDGTNTNGITVIFTTSRNPPPSGGVVIRNNDMNGDTLVGCTVQGTTCSGNS